MDTVLLLMSLKVSLNASETKVASRLKFVLMAKNEKAIRLSRDVPMSA